jgi:hypothetical protein
LALQEASTSQITQLAQFPPENIQKDEIKPLTASFENHVFFISRFFYIFSRLLRILLTQVLIKLLWKQREELPSLKKK